MCLKTSLFNESYCKAETLIGDVLSMQVTKRQHAHACMTDAHAPHPHAFQHAFVCTCTSTSTIYNVACMDAL